MFIYNNIKIADANDKLIQSCLLTEDETVWFSQEQTAEEESVMRILIAEDETELARGLKFLLEKNKFTVDMVHDGEEALAYFRWIQLYHSWTYTQSMLHPSTRTLAQPCSLLFYS